MVKLETLATTEEGSGANSGDDWGDNLGDKLCDDWGDNLGDYSCGDYDMYDEFEDLTTLDTLQISLDTL